MKYISIWRAFIVVLIATIVYSAFFYWWSQDTFTIISPGITMFFVKWWFMIAIPMLFVTSVMGTVLILFGTSPNLLIRIPLALLAWVTAPIPLIFLFYWLFFVEQFRPNNSFKARPLRGPP